ncbi:20929_t:CDS:2 [Gigaspora rosea]|nr:20929_t:CDS:2 [Gigaspora rosea]
MKQINSGSVASTQQKDAAPEDHTAPPQQPQQSTDVNPSAEKGKDMAQLTGNYPPTPVLNELIMRALEVTLQDQDITTTTAPAQLTMLSTNLHLIKLEERKPPDNHKVERTLSTMELRTVTTVYSTLSMTSPGQSLFLPLGAKLVV